MEQELQYAYLLEIPVESCRVVTRRPKRRTRAAETRVKERVISRVNQETEAENLQKTDTAAAAVAQNGAQANQNKERYAQNTNAAPAEGEQSSFSAAPAEGFSFGAEVQAAGEFVEATAREGSHDATLQPLCEQDSPANYGELPQPSCEGAPFCENASLCEESSSFKTENPQQLYSENTQNANSFADEYPNENAPLPLCEVMEELPEKGEGEGVMRHSLRPSASEKRAAKKAQKAAKKAAKGERAEKGELHAETGTEITEKPRAGVPFLAAVSVCALLALALLLNAFFFRFDAAGYLAALLKTPDTRTHADFALAMPVSGECSAEGGVITCEKQGGVYAPAAGKVMAVTQTESGYTVEIAHSDCFKTVISGAELAFFSVGERVYRAQPVAYNRAESVTVGFYENGVLLTELSVENSVPTFS